MKKMRTARAYREEERHRSSDRWIPFKFPERPTTIRSTEVAREINHRRFGDRQKGQAEQMKYRVEEQNDKAEQNDRVEKKQSRTIEQS